MSASVQECQVSLKCRDTRTLGRLSLHTVCDLRRTLNLQTIKTKNEEDGLSNESFS